MLGLAKASFVTNRGDVSDKRAFVTNRGDVLDKRALADDYETYTLMEIPIDSTLNQSRLQVKSQIPASALDSGHSSEY